MSEEPFGGATNGAREGAHSTLLRAGSALPKIAMLKLGHIEMFVSFRADASELRRVSR
jgi:hypothetical protein